MNKYLYFIHIFIISLLKINYSVQECFEYSCEECDSPEYGNCTKCRNTFTLKDGTCPCSFSSCALCTTGLAGLNICEQCKNGYYSFNKDCYCLVNNCEQCAEDGCNKCISGYYYNETLKECIKQLDEEKNCFDPNCDGCYSEEQGACEYCKEGFDLKKGECLNISLPINGVCSDGYYLSNNKYCLEKCSGVNCSKVVYPGIVSLCPDNKCLICQFNVIKIFSECDNSEECSLSEGCLNCITNDECLICEQGYYLLGGICKKCSEGCSICSSEYKCEYCLSGYELTESGICNLTYNFDYNTDLYKARKNNLISIYYPEEIPNIENTEVNQKTENVEKSEIIEKTGITEITEKIIHLTQSEVNNIIDKTGIPYNILLNISNHLNYINIFSCDKNCIKCFDNTGKCIECDNNYILKENKCFLKCVDENCLNCELNSQICTKCNENYTLKDNKCVMNCEDENCLICESNITKCSTCKDHYILKEDKCIFKCSDENCLNCELKDGIEVCNQCPIFYEKKEEKCEIICMIDNCLECSVVGNSKVSVTITCSKCKDNYHFDGIKCKKNCKDDNCADCLEDTSICTSCESNSKLYNGKCAKNYQYCKEKHKDCNFCFDDIGCIECLEGYELKNNNCKEKKGILSYIIISVIILILIIGTLFYCIYTNRKQNLRNVEYDQQSEFNSNNPQIYNIRNNLDLSGSFRNVLNRDEIAEEYEAQRAKQNKAKMTCMFCKKKLGNYKCDCGCIVCKEHSNLKDIEKDGQMYKECYNCGKMVNKVSQIKYDCNICMQKKNSVVHFKCGCSLEVCKNCYIKCKMSNNKCPGCRAIL